MATTATLAESAHAPPSAPRPDIGTIHAFLKLLARAVQTFKLYPQESAFCSQAIAACHDAHTALGGRHRLVLHVRPAELLVDGVAIGAGTVIEHELARRLYRARVAELTIHGGATARDWLRFCADVIACEVRHRDAATLAERLVEHGVETIVAGMASRPEVLQAGSHRPAGQGVPSGPVQERVPGAAESSVGYLYPAGKGWVRVESGVPVDAISLRDLAVMIDDPVDFSMMLLRLSCESGTEDVSREAALRAKFDEVATIYESLEPHSARAMFARLSSAVLSLDAGGRNALLKRAVLPALVEGRPGGDILNEFPDVDLVEAIGLLLEAETAQSGLINAALTRLDLSDERREALGPLLQRRLTSADRDRSHAGGEAPDAIGQCARHWITVDATVNKSFAELAAFDLAFDADARNKTSGAAEAIETADAQALELACLLSLVRLIPSPQVAEDLLRRVVGVLATLEQAERWDEYAAAVGQARGLGATLAASRPDVADAVWRALAAFCTRHRARRVLRLHESGDEERAGRVVEAFGNTICPAFVALVDDGLPEPTMTALSRLLRTHARMLADGMALELKRSSRATTAKLLALLSTSGPGFERLIAGQLKDGDDDVFRVAVDGLARIGTRSAIAAMTTQIRTGAGWRREAAMEALWRFPKDLVTPSLVEILTDRDLVSTHPRVGYRLLEGARAARLEVPRETLRELSRLTFRFWRPMAVCTGFAARRLLAR